MLIKHLQKKSQLFITIFSYAFYFLLLNIHYYLFHFSLNLNFFYLLPLLILVWKVGSLAGFIYSLFMITMGRGLAILISPSASFSHHFENWLVQLLSCGAIIYVLDGFKRERISARTDSLTQIANRHYFVELAVKEIERASRYQRSFAVVYIDTDNFKGVNDDFGHEAGDNLLKLIAKTLKENIRSTDIVARLGGDEFVVILEEVKAPQAEKIVSKLRSYLLQKTEEAKFPVTYSIGLALFKKPPSSVDDMLKKADALMYKAKKGSKNKIVAEVFS